MRVLPFMKRKKGFQYAGTGFDTVSGGGGGGGGGSVTPTVYTGTLSDGGQEVTLDTGVTGFDAVGGYVTATYPGEGEYIYPVGYYNNGSEYVRVSGHNGSLRIKATLGSHTNISYKVTVYGLEKE